MADTGTPTVSVTFANDRHPDPPFPDIYGYLVVAAIVALIATSSALLLRRLFPSTRRWLGALIAASVSPLLLIVAIVIERMVVERMGFFRSVAQLAHLPTQSDVIFAAMPIFGWPLARLVFWFMDWREGVRRRVDPKLFG